MNRRAVIVKRGVALSIVLAFMTIGAQMSWAKYEQEQLALEAQFQQRIETILSKTLPANSYLVTVKVEMDQSPKAASIRSTSSGGRNPFLKENRFILPGVPQKKEFGEPANNATNETVVNAFTDEALIKKVSITILVSADIAQDQLRAVRDLISSSIPFNPIRGDEMEITPSPLLGKTEPPPAPTAPVTSPATSAMSSRNSGGILNGFSDRGMLPIVVVLTVLAVILIILIAFLFGPVRAFLNRLLAVLPRVGEQAAYAVSNAPAKANAPGNTQTLGSITAMGGINGAHGRNGMNGTDMPFRFIQEEQLGKLPILLRQMSAPQAALVVAYLPPEWASRVLNGLDADAQAVVMAELSQAREVPPEVVKEVEQQVKSKLPYLVGGADWIQSVYQLTQPQTQRVLLNTLNQQSPEVADALRRKTFFFEDVFALNAGALRLVIQELGYPATALSIKDEPARERETLLRKLPAAMREIIEQELELSSGDQAAVTDAKSRLVALARRLLAEGRISLGEKKS